MEIKPGKYRTRDGQCAVVAGLHPKNGAVVGWVGYDVETWKPDGTWQLGGYWPLDLIAPWVDPPAPVERWLNIHPQGHLDQGESIRMYLSKEFADNNAGTRIACIKITYVPGEGL